jgi:hypothetical protein
MMRGLPSIQADKGVQIKSQTIRVSRIMLKINTVWLEEATIEPYDEAVL